MYLQREHKFCRHLPTFYLALFIPSFWLFSWLLWATLANYQTWGGSCRKPPYFIAYWSGVRTCNREGNGTPIQYSCLENPMDGGAWWATVHAVAKSRTWLSDFPFTFHFHALEKEMTTHSSVLARRIPGTGEPGGLPSVGSHGVGHDWSDLAAAAAAARTCNWHLKWGQPMRLDWILNLWVTLNLLTLVISVRKKLN